MKAIQSDRKLKYFFRLLCIIGVTFRLTSCDVLESDPDVLSPSTEITGKEVFVLANSPSFIDLNAKVQTNVGVRVAVTSEPRYGQLTDLGKGILQYSPSVGNNKARDGFEFTVYSLNNDIVKRDSVIIYIENDSTNLPCNIYPRPDYVHGVPRDSILIDVKSNDIICGGSVDVSVFKPDQSFPPYFGQAEIDGDKIRYIPGTAFKGIDKILYKLTTAMDTSRYAYGVVYITKDSACSFRISDDYYTLTEFAIDSLIALPVFANDSLCHSTAEYQINLKTPPRFGQAAVILNGFSYKVPSSVDFPFNDHFAYEVCKDAVCKTARVNIILNASCALSARQDSVTLNDNVSQTVYINVLLNDSICGGLKSLKIIEPPNYGTSDVINEQISYQPNPTHKEDDELEYEICNQVACVRATVIIKRTK